jgi:hypothetical protein
VETVGFCGAVAFDIRQQSCIVHDFKRRELASTQERPAKNFSCLSDATSSRHPLVFVDRQSNCTAFVDQ